MILQRVSLCNFRQFNGTQTLEFASGSEGNNVTVIFGENGRGKTGIFRAVMFCLFGDRRLSQDGDTPEHELYLVNTSALHQADPNTPVEAYVQLEFEHRGVRYLLDRRLLGMDDDGRQIEQNGPAKLTVTDLDGNTKIVQDPTEIRGMVNAILDRGVREYFLFDGEKIERLTRASAEHRKEVAKGIRSLLNVDALETAIAATKRLVKTFEAELDTEADVELRRLIKRLQENEEARDRTKDRLAQLSDEISKAVDEKRQIDEELDKFNEIRELVERRNLLSDQLRSRQQDAGFALAEMKQLVGRCANLIVMDTVDSVFTYIDERKEKGEIPPQVRMDLIDRIVADHKCICDREVLEGTAAYDAIIAWRGRSASPELERAAIDLWSDLKGLVSEHEELARSATTKVYQYANINNDMRGITERLNDISKQIGGSERKDAQELEHQRSYLQKRLIDMEAERQRLDDSLRDLLQDQQSLKAQRKSKEQEMMRNSELSRRALLASDTHEALVRVYDSFTQEIRERIGHSATEIFHELIDQEGRRSLPRIVVDEDYSLQVYDRWNKPFLANISAGQRQVMSIAFIAALASAVSVHDLIEMPLFMDTPFGRLSFEHRRNLINMVPGFAAQWILLATDTEFRKQEAQLLKSTDRWGRFYLLRADGEDDTQIREIDISDSLALLRERSIADEDGWQHQS